MCLATPAQIKTIDEERNTAVVDFGGIERTISLGILNNVKENDYVLIHAGFAIGGVVKKEAEDTRAALAELKHVMRELHNGIDGMA